MTKIIRPVRLARPEREEAHSPGQRPGLLRTQTCRPVRAKALKLQTISKAFALTGRLADCHYYPGRCPGLGASALSGRAAYRSFGTFQPYRSKLFDFIIYILSFFLIFISQRAEMLIRDLLMDFSHHVFFDK